jgi:hypothetical protein
MKYEKVVLAISDGLDIWLARLLLCALGYWLLGGMPPQLGSMNTPQALFLGFFLGLMARKI